MKNDDGTLAINRSRCVFSGNDVIWSLPRPAASVCFSWSAGTDDHYREVATPYVTDFVKANPVIRENAAHFIMEVSGWQPPEESESILPAAQRMAIEELKLPQSVKMFFGK